LHFSSFSLLSSLPFIGFSFLSFSLH
jgi:hypothetical protein